MSTAPSLYRRHRPRTFADVVGQEHVVRTLRNAVEQGKVHHAYLFVGSRGTGKTSMAKILAACLNCTGAPTRPTVEPCGHCESCVAIASATSLDVIEMDAASNNSVDDVRDLRESVAFAPVSGGAKVYILDEAHMLTPQAWNAFLKTLEEPPPNTIFVLATTEAQKVLPTVVDRCHRFDFHRPTVEQLAAVVQRVATQEGIAIPPDAVAVLARHATGSFRDALGTLEQLVTYSGEQIAVEDVLAVLGVADADLLFGALDAVASAKAADALRAADRLAGTGRDVVQFLRDLEAHARELLVVQTLGEVPPQLAVTPDRDARLAAQADRVPAAACVRLLDLIAAAMRAIKDGADARTQLELALVKAATPAVDGSTRALLARIERLEGALAGGAAPAAVAPAPPPAPATVAPVPTAPPAAPQAVPPPPPVEAAPPPAQAAPPPPQAAPPPPADAPTPIGTFGLDELSGMWPDVQRSVTEAHTLLGALLADARPVAADGGAVTIAFPESDAFSRRKCEDAGNRQVIAEAIRTLTGVQPRLSFELRSVEELATVGPAPPPPPTEAEWVDRFKDAFDATEILPDDDEDTP